MDALSDTDGDLRIEVISSSGEITDVEIEVYDSL